VFCGTTTVVTEWMEKALLARCGEAGVDLGSLCRDRRSGAGRSLLA
jgi:hypothetical protein